jgi:hypothetical protein
VKENRNTPERPPGAIAAVLAHGAVVIWAAAPIGVATRTPSARDLAPVNDNQPRGISP